MEQNILPEGYRPLLSIYETQMAIGRLREFLENNLSLRLNLTRVSAPLFVDAESGISDYLAGTTQPVSFDISCGSGKAQVVQSLSKWKRMALYRYGFPVGTGLWTNMNAIRREGITDPIHSLYVDQWDWEKVITPEQRTVATLQNTIRTIVGIVCDTSIMIRNMYPALYVLPDFSREVTFITAQELEDLYPDLDPYERESVFTKEHRTVFVQGVGAPLKSGKPHRRRAPDYDDWTMNGTLLFWHDVIARAIPIASIGVRVDETALRRQLAADGQEALGEMPFHKLLLDGKLPATIGGGIGQSRVSMLLLGKAHIGEVQASVWDAETTAACEEQGVPLL